MRPKPFLEQTPHIIYDMLKDFFSDQTEHRTLYDILKVFLPNQRKHRTLCDMLKVFDERSKIRRKIDNNSKTKNRTKKNSGA